ncbi:MAG: cytochrome-c oxidase, cbb3-type subunit III [Pseudorhodobacter sp.]|nr:cytochrome-c oxidase, cbb3-type subunit III [Pseudorhodobacter sp.]
MCAKSVKPDAKVSTTGHVWDGIEELNNPLPRWWVWVFILTIVFAAGYIIAYPAWPLIHGATPGVLGYSTRAEVQKDIDAVDAQNAPIKARLVAADLTAIDADPELKKFAMSDGAAVFRTNCAQCHGAGAAGVQGKGYPNLLDNDWLWGGTLDAIHTTLTHGIRATVDPDTRISAMPRFGTDELLTRDEIGQVVEYVLQLSGQDHDATLAAAGTQLFADNCAACHGDAGMGNRDMGAPNLTDAIWLYGGDRTAITTTVTLARNAMMPAWGYAAAGSKPRLTEDQIRAVAVYVHALGGGE